MDNFHYGCPDINNGNNGIDPRIDLRNHMTLAGIPPLSHRQPYGPSIYQSEFLPPPNPYKRVAGLEARRYAEMLPSRHNYYRPTASKWHEHLERADAIVPRQPVKCEPCTGVKFPCRAPRSNISNVHMDDGFGTYNSETKDKFDRPTAQAYAIRSYDAPSGFSHSFIRPAVPRESCCDDDVDINDIKDTNPTRYNPWPRLLMGHKSLIHREYRPDDIEYSESTISGLSDEPQTYIY